MYIFIYILVCICAYMYMCVAKCMFVFIRMHITNICSSLLTIDNSRVAELHSNTIKGYNLDIYPNLVVLLKQDVTYYMLLMKMI